MLHYIFESGNLHKIVNKNNIYSFINLIEVTASSRRKILLDIIPDSKLFVYGDSKKIYKCSDRYRLPLSQEVS